MADCPLPFHQAQQCRGVPSCEKRAGGWWDWECRRAGLGGGVGLSLQPINSSLTKHLREISHALLTPCAENQRHGPPEKGIPYGHTGNTTPDEGQHMV